MRRIWVIALALAFATGIGHAQQSTQQTDPAATAPPVDLETMTPPRPLNNVEAEFPLEAQAKGIDGRCAVSLIVDVTGMPRNLTLLRCNDPAFGKNSLDAAAKYRFKPATRKDGTPIPVQISVDIGYLHLHPGASYPKALVRYGFFTPPGTTSDLPGADGVYPLTKSVTPPAITKFSDEDYGNEAFRSPGGGACEVVLTISAKGKPSDPSLTHCEQPILEKPAVASLLKSRYRPGTLNGIAVPVRMSIHLEFGGFAPTK
jgi:TonB family protein